MNRCMQHFQPEPGTYTQCAQEATYRVTYTYRGEWGEHTESNEWCARHFADEVRITAYEAEAGDGEGWDEMHVAVI